jgi:hypothetical protein
MPILIAGIDRMIGVVLCLDLVSAPYPSWNCVNTSTTLFLPVAVNGWGNQ